MRAGKKIKIIPTSNDQLDKAVNIDDDIKIIDVYYVYKEVPTLSNSIRKYRLENIITMFLLAVIVDCIFES